MDKLFGIAEKSMQLTEDRASLITTNLVNGSTPGYKAKDIDFYDVLKNVDQSGAALTTSNPNHINLGQDSTMNNIKYRIPMQTSMDGNTVDPEIERKNYLENSLRYQVSLTFIKGKTSELSKAIKGD